MTHGHQSDDLHDFAGNPYHRWISLLARHRPLLAAILLLTGALFSWLSAGIRWNADLLAFFSGNSADVAAMRQAADSAGVASQLRIDLHFATPAGKPQLLAASSDVAQRLRDTRLFRSVWSGADPGALASSYAHLIGQAPLLLSDTELATLDARATPDALADRFAAVKNHLADPDGEFLARQLQTDPLNLSALLATRLQSLAPDNAPNVSLDDGALLAAAPDGPHAMLVADPLALPSDTHASEEMLAATNAAIAAATAAHPGLHAWIVGAHRGYVDNANRVQSDVTRISLLGSLGVALSIALFFRRLAPALLCLIPPAVGVGLSLGIAGLLHIQLPLILLGFAGLLCGSTTDYGIQLIAESRRLSQKWGGWHTQIPAAAAHNLLGPISMSVATSVTGFAALALSDAPGLRALGLFVAAATIAIWLITFLIFPAYLTAWVLPNPKPLATNKSKIENGKSKIRPPWILACAAFLAMTTASLLPAARVRFNADPHALDGSSQNLRADEAAFYSVWGDIRNRAILLVSAPDPATALTAQQNIDSYLRDLLRDHRIANITSAAPLLPDPATAHSRAAAWQSHWTPDARASLRKNLEAAARATGFTPAPFAQYADRLTDLSPPAPAAQLRDSPAALFPGLITETKSETTLAAIIQMNAGVSPRLATAWAPELRLRFASLPQGAPTILSGNVLLFDATDRARAEGERFAPWCLLAILLPLCLYFKNLRRAWLALTCLLVGFLWFLAAAHLLAGGLNLLSLVPILFTLGVAVDYGIYAATDPALSPQHSALSTRMPATALCALTTLLGSGSLILASHPALRWLGITLVAGISGGYLASLFIVAPLTRYANRSRTKSRPRLARIARLSVTTALALLTLLLLIPPIAEWQLSRERPALIADPGHDSLLQIAPRTFTVGPSWMRYRPTSETAGLWEIALSGDPAHRGRAVSLLADNLDFRIESEMLDQLDTLLPQEWARWLVLRGVGANMASLPQYIPAENQQEIYAAASSFTDPHAYLAPTYPRILSYHALHDISQMLIDNPLIVPNSFACTGVVSLPDYSAPTSGHLLLARNFDFEGGESFARQKSLTYIVPPPNEGIPFAHVAWPGLAGCVTGINQEKIALFINAAATRDFHRIGTPTILVARDVLQHARSLDDAQRIIEAAQVFVSDIMVVADGKTGTARVFEKSPAKTAHYDVDQSAALANHLTTPAFAADPVNRSRIDDGTTGQRLTRARQLLDQMHHHVSPENLAALLRDKRGLDDTDLGLGNRNAIDGLIACHSVIIDATSGHLWIAGFPNAEGQYLGIDVLTTLDHLARNRDHPDPDFLAPASPPAIPPDTILTDGTWDRLIASRGAADNAVDALHRHDPRAALSEAQLVIDNNPHFYLGHELMARALLALNEKPAAKIALQKALAADPPYASRRTALQELIKQCDSR